MIGKKAIVAGATGSVGRLIVQTCLNDARVDQVTAVVRKEVPPEKAAQLWGGGGDESANNDNNGNNNNFSKLKQVQVDYPSLDVTNSKLKEAFRGHDAFLTGLGLYSGNTTQAEMDQVEYQYNTILASIAHKDGGAKRGAYLSGQGVKQPTKEGRAMAMFGRVKGRAEERLAEIFSSNTYSDRTSSSSDPEEEDEKEGGRGHVSVRPGAIFDRPGEPVYGVLEQMLAYWPFHLLKDTKYGISAHDIAKGMVQGALFDDNATVHGNTIWENDDIKEAARRYDQQKDDNKEN